MEIDPRMRSPPEWVAAGWLGSAELAPVDQWEASIETATE